MISFGNHQILVVCCWAGATLLIASQPSASNNVMQHVCDAGIEPQCGGPVDCIPANSDDELILLQQLKGMSRVQKTEEHSKVGVFSHKEGIFAPEHSAWIDPVASHAASDGVAWFVSAIRQFGGSFDFAEELSLGQFGGTFGWAEVLCLAFVIVLLLVGGAAIKYTGSLATQVQGTVLVVSAAMAFAVVALMIKKNQLPTALAVEARFLISWTMCVFCMLRYRSQRGLKWFGPVEVRWRLVLRGCLTYIFVISWWAALPLAPLGDCTALVYCGPLLTTMLSGMVLGEKMPALFPVQALMAIAGMCLIVQPPWLLSVFGLNRSNVDDNAMTGYKLIVAAMLAVAFMPIVTFQTKKASWIEVEHVTCCLAAFVFNPVAIYCQHIANSEMLDSLSLPVATFWGSVLIVTAALGSFVADALQTQGYQMAEPGKAVMFRYLEIPFSYLLQCVATDTVLSWPALVGAMLAGLSCVLGAYGQLRNSREDITLEDDITLEAMTLVRSVSTS